MKSFYPVLYLCFLFGLLPFLGSCSEENESSGTIEMNQLPGTAQSFLSNYFPGQTPEKIERTNTDVHFLCNRMSRQFLITNIFIDNP